MEFSLSVFDGISLVLSSSSSGWSGRAGLSVPAGEAPQP